MKSLTSGLCSFPNPLSLPVYRYLFGVCAAPGAFLLLRSYIDIHELHDRATGVRGGVDTCICSVLCQWACAFWVFCQACGWRHCVTSFSTRTAEEWGWGRPALGGDKRNHVLPDHPHWPPTLQRGSLLDSLFGWKAPHSGERESEIAEIAFP